MIKQLVVDDDQAVGCTATNSIKNQQAGRWEVELKPAALVALEVYLSTQFLAVVLMTLAVCSGIKLQFAQLLKM